MSFCNNHSFSYHPIVDEDITNSNNQTKRNKLIKIIIISAVCTIAVLTFLGIGIIFCVIFKQGKSKFDNSTINANSTPSAITLTSQLLTSITPTWIRISSGTNTTINSSTCHLPLYPMYNKSGTTVAGITSKYGRDLNQLFWPNCVYLDSKQNIYICDTTNNRIVKYSQSNVQVQFIDFSSGTKLPRRLYIDHRTDDLYLLDLNQDNNYRIHYLPQNPTKSKETILLTGSQTDSFGMTLDLDLNIYVSESANHRVVKWLSPDYEEYLVVAGNGIPGYELNQLTSPKGIYLDLVNNDLYVADEHRIQRWPSGSSIGQTVGLTGVQYPQDIQRDCHGNFYVTVDDTIKLFSQSVETTGLEGLVLVGVPSNDKSVKYTNITELLLNPQGIYLDMKNGDLYVADTGLHRIQKFSINNEFVPVKKINSSSFSSLSQTCRISLNTTWETNGITVAGNINGCGSGSNRLCNPHDIFLDEQNTLFVVDTDNDRIQKYTSSGSITVASQGLYKPQSMYVDSSTGDMYILDLGLNDTINDKNYRIQLWRANSTLGITIINGTGESYCMSVDRYLNIYTVDTNYGRVRKWYAHTNYSISITVAGTQSVGSGIHQLSRPQCIYVDYDTNSIYIIDKGNRRIVKWKSDLADNAITAELVLSDELISYAYGITLDCKKNIYLTVSKNNGLIYQFGEQTNQTLKILGDNGRDWGRIIYNPTGIKFDSFGNIFVTETAKTRIVKFPIIL